MIQKKVILSETVRLDIDALSDFIISVSRPEHAERYTQNLLDELADLSYLATIRPECPWKLPKRYHSQAKTLPICRRKLTAIFHIDGDYVIVDKIMPSSLITY